MPSDNDRAAMVREEAVRDWFTPGVTDVLLTRDGHGRVRVTKRVQRVGMLGGHDVVTEFVDVDPAGSGGEPTND